MKPSVIFCLCLLLAVTQARAEEPEGPPSETPPEARAPEELAREGVELLLRALRGFLEAVPQYGLPRLDEKGDIIIPRLDPKQAPENEADEEPSPGGIRT